jgi:hydroxyacylglutathione hydrolase
VIDPAFLGREEQQVLENMLREKGLTVEGQINTHCHVDHILGVEYMKSVHRVPFRAHVGELPVVRSSHIMGEMFGWSLDPIKQIDEVVDEGQEIRTGNHELKILFVPGHSPGSIALHSEEGGFVITGDALFRNSIGRTDLPGGDYDTLLASIAKNLLVLPDETRVYPGHGPATTIGEERRQNPFLRTIV